MVKKCDESMQRIVSLEERSAGVLLGVAAVEEKLLAAEENLLARPLVSSNAAVESENST